MIEIRNLSLPLDVGVAHGDEEVRHAAADRLAVGIDAIESIKMIRRSIDARRKADVHFVATIQVMLTPETVKRGEGAFIAGLGDAEVCLSPVSMPVHRAPLSSTPDMRPLVVGTGPAGLFAALMLARNGACPLVVERGRTVDARRASIATFIQMSTLDPSSNIVFGEGGAGTFSDGKLTTNTHDPRCRTVLESFASAGAPAEILWQAKPHIGTDMLAGVVSNLRREIESLGGEVRFGVRLADIHVDHERLTGVTLATSDGVEDVEVGILILATGHSARDTFEMVYRRGLHLRQKPFSVGVRIEHDQERINHAQYGAFSAHPALGAAEYKLSCHLPNGRSVYTFCMCPGGEVVAATSETGGVVTNGMSRFSRTGKNANAAFLVNVTPGDFESDHPLAGIAFQRRIEQTAFAAGGGKYRAPAQRMEDFLLGRPSISEGSVTSTYPLGVTYTDLAACLPLFVVESLKEAAPLFDRRLRGFATPDAMLTGVETRSSSPVRIVRDDTLQSNICGLYPCGEGAGYAGGIMSAAVDGIRVAETVLDRYAEIM